MRQASACLLAAGVLLCGHTAECEQPPRLRFSMVPQNDTRKELAAFQPLFDTLRRDLGIPVDVLAPSSYGAVIEDMLAGNVDLARMGPAAYISAKRQEPRITPFASVSKTVDGKEESFYYSYLIVRTDSPDGTIASLKEKTLALVDPDSTSGALIPKHAFSRLTGMPLDRYFGRITYSGSHNQSIANVMARQADAAFVSSTELATFFGGRESSELKVLWKSTPIPRDPFVLRDALCPALKKKIREAFFRDGNRNPELMKQLGITRFIPVEDADYQVVRELP